jgi:hypothetical protein
VSIGHYVGVAVPFTVEEILTLAAFARSEGGSIVELIRTRALELRDDAMESSTAADEDLTTMMALLEGIRIRGRPRG